VTYQLPSLKYDYDALEPIIDAETMRLHHDVHHRAYVDAVNVALAEVPLLQNKTIEQLMRQLEDVPEALRSTVRVQGGGHANHQLFWKIMTSPAQGGDAPTGDLAQAIARDFGSLGSMKQAFEDSASRHFGAGWTFLVMDPPSKRLEILTLPDNESVLPLGKPALFVNDLWEHAYCLKHGNKRLEYLKAWWRVLNWRYVAERLQGLLEGRKQL
jgi:superoxide dismutase, Fe-Mn family